MSDWDKPDTIFLALLILAFAWYSCGDNVALEPTPPPPFTIDNGVQP